MWKWEAVTLYVLSALSIALSVLQIGKPRTVLTPGVALAGIVGTLRNENHD